jgi:hypothetical protein
VRRWGQGAGTLVVRELQVGDCAAVVRERRSRVGVGGEEAARERRRSGSDDREWVSVVRKRRSRVKVDEGAAKL